MNPLEHIAAGLLIAYFTLILTSCNLWFAAIVALYATALSFDAKL